MVGDPPQPGLLESGLAGLAGRRATALVLVVGVTPPMPACSHTVLEDGDLRSSYLRRDDPTGVSPPGARANASTEWLYGFDWRRAGVTMDDEPGAHRALTGSASGRGAEAVERGCRHGSPWAVRPHSGNSEHLK